MKYDTGPYVMIPIDDDTRSGLDIWCCTDVEAAAWLVYQACENNLDCGAFDSLIKNAEYAGCWKNRSTSSTERD